jgi:predicted acyltransferase
MSDRDRSLDVFRGATVALMILVNNPGSWSHLYGPLTHAAWHGWTLRFSSSRLAMLLL